MLFMLSLCLLLAAALSISTINPCFQDHSSEHCIAFIAEKRHITTSEALILRRRALALYVNEESSPFAVYDLDTLAVACLASDGILRPGPDSDCAACKDACTKESRTQVCNLYCTSSRSLSQTTLRLSVRWTITTMKKERDRFTIASHTKEDPLRQEKLETPIIKIIIISILIVGAGLTVLFCTILIWVKTKRSRTRHQEILVSHSGKIVLSKLFLCNYVFTVQYIIYTYVGCGRHVEDSFRLPSSFSQRTVW